jgi:hypothetical protein
MDHIDGPGRTILSVAMCFDPEFGIWNYRLGVFLQTRWATKKELIDANYLNVLWNHCSNVSL